MCFVNNTKIYNALIIVVFIKQDIYNTDDVEKHIIKSVAKLLVLIIVCKFATEMDKTKD